MTSKLKCPFCGEKLYKSNDCHVCFNANCIFANNYLFDEKWWAITKLKQALIQAKQDLEIAKNGLNKVITKTNSQVVRGFEYIATGIVKVAKDTLKQIEHKE